MLITYDNWYDIPGNVMVTITDSATGELLATNERGHGRITAFFDFYSRGRIRKGYTAEADI